MAHIDLDDSSEDFHSFDGTDDFSDMPPRKKQRASTPFAWNGNGSAEQSGIASPTSDNEIAIDGIDPMVLSFLGEDPKTYLKNLKAEEKHREKDLKLKKEREAKDHEAAMRLQELYNNGQDPDFDGDLAILSDRPATSTLPSSTMPRLPMQPTPPVSASNTPLNGSARPMNDFSATAVPVRESRPYQASSLPPHLAQTPLRPTLSQPAPSLSNGLNGQSSIPGRPMPSVPGAFPTPPKTDPSTTPYGSWDLPASPYGPLYSGLSSSNQASAAEAQRRYQALYQQMQTAQARRNKAESGSKSHDFIDLTTPSATVGTYTPASTSGEKRKFPSSWGANPTSVSASTSKSNGINPPSSTNGRPSVSASNVSSGILGSNATGPYTARSGPQPSISTSTSASGSNTTSGLLNNLLAQARTAASSAGGKMFDSLFGGNLNALRNEMMGSDWSRSIPIDDDDWDDSDIEGYMIDKMSGFNDYRPDDYAGGYDYWSRSDPAKVQEELRDLMNNIRPDTDLGAAERKDTPDAIAESSNLYPHQQLGLAWLISMEISKSKGGILADDMGLGKTVQAIALMVSRPSEDKACKTTLIIAPVALMRQWESEIQTKIKPQFELKTHMYYGTSGKNIDWKKLKEFDVVLTSYGTVAAEYKRSLEIAERMKKNPGWRPTAKSDRLPLHSDQSVFYRIILDEAQNVKNKSTLSAKAVYNLQAKNRLCMTGTPMMNNIGELYSLVHFLRIKPYCEYERFSADFIQPLKKRHGTEKAMQKLQAFLKAILLRRTKKSEIDGKPILTLPERTTVITHSEFDEGQMDFYNALQTNAQIQFNKYVKAGTIGKNYANVLVMLLRLRQACCHPHLIQDFADDHMGDPDEREENCLARAKDLSDVVVNRLKADGVVDCPICMDAPENATIFLPCGHYCCLECFTRMADNARMAGNESSNKFKCPNCRGDIDPKMVTDWTSFKKIHMPDLLANTVIEKLVPDDDDEDDIDSDDSDSEVEEEDDEAKLRAEMKDFIVDDDASIEQNGSDDEYLAGDDDEDLNVKVERDQRNKRRLSRINKLKKQLSDSEDDDDDDLEAKPKDRGYAEGSNPFQKAMGQKTLTNGDKSDKPKDKGKGKARRDPNRPKKKKLTLADLKKQSTKNAAAMAKYHKRLRKDFVSSAKIDSTMQLLRDIRARGQNEKTIIFSQFTSLLDLLQIPIMDEGWGMRRYDGSMSAGLRHDAVLDFTSNPNSTVMLVSLKAGNSGLNLTAANNVIIFDPFWNPYIEEQAIDRAHRIGQRRPVNVYRILVKETVEDRIVALQEKKRALIEGALDEAASQSVGRLSTAELSYLFGVTPGVGGAR